MAIFFVFQGKSYTQESVGGYVWSPQTTKSGTQNPGYNTVAEIRKGDYILHCDHGNIKAISIAESDCQNSEKPGNLQKTKIDAEKNVPGFKVNCDYVFLNKPLQLSEHWEWLSNNYEKDSAFRKDGKGKQRYMCFLSDTHASYLIKEALALQPPESRAWKRLAEALKNIES